MTERLPFRLAGPAALTAVLLAAAAMPALALDPVNKTRKGLALQGYDPVAYFTDGRPVEGKAEHAFAWMGATWRFASAGNRDAFAAEPARYAPQYGGYCAYAVSENYTADVDPQAWRIVDGKLYLNYSLKVRGLWEQDVSGRIARADANWPRLVAGK